MPSSQSAAVPAAVPAAARLSLLVALLSFIIAAGADEGGNFRAPVFQWAQTKEHVHIKVMLKSGAKDKIAVDFTGGNTGNVLLMADMDVGMDVRLNLDLLLGIDPETSTYKVHGHYITLKIAKKPEGFWSRLLLSKKRPSNMKIDWKRWKDPPDHEPFIDGGDPEDDVEEDTRSRSRRNSKKRRRRRTSKKKESTFEDFVFGKSLDLDPSIIRRARVFALIAVLLGSLAYVIRPKHSEDDNENGESQPNTDSLDAKRANVDRKKTD